MAYAYYLINHFQTCICKLVSKKYMFADTCCHKFKYISYVISRCSWEITVINGCYSNNGVGDSFGFLRAAGKCREEDLAERPGCDFSQLHDLERKVEEVTARNADLNVKYNALSTQTNEMQAKIVKIPTQMCKSRI